MTPLLSIGGKATHIERRDQRLVRERALEVGRDLIPRRFQQRARIADCLPLGHIIVARAAGAVV